MGKLSNRRKKNRRQLIVLAFILFFAGIAFAQYQNWKATRDLVQAQFANPDGSTSPSFWLEIAATDSERARGLMFRKELPDDRGMLFIFPYSEVQRFWMKNAQFGSRTRMAMRRAQRNIRYYTCSTDPDIITIPCALWTFFPPAGELLK